MQNSFFKSKTQNNGNRISRTQNKYRNILDVTELRIKGPDQVKPLAWMPF